MTSDRANASLDHASVGDCGEGANVLSRVPQGAIRYCKDCDRYGLEFGTAYVSLSPRQLSRMADLSRRLLERQRAHTEERRVGLALGPTNVALILDSEQLVSFHSLVVSAMSCHMCSHETIN